MPETIDSSPRVRFGAFVLDVATRKLWRGDELLPLPARAIDVLAHLIARRGRIVDKEELVAAVWHDVAVTDDSLIHAVSVIRRALGDEPSNASFVETVPRRGYRFVGHVEASEEAESVQPRRSVAPRAWGVGAALVLLALAALPFAWRSYQTARAASRASGSTPSSLEQAPPPGTTLASGGVVSPVGGHLALVAQDARTGKTALWIRAANAAEPRLVPGTEGASKPFFSPDGRRIAFFVNGHLTATDLDGGHARTIAEVRGAAAGGSWGSSGVIVFAEWTSGLSTVADTGGSVTPLTTLDHAALDVAHAWPQFLPGGRRLLYQIVSPDTGRAGVYVASLDTRESARLLDKPAAAYVDPGFLLYLQHDMLMVEAFDAGRLRLGGRAVLLARGVAPSSLAEGAAISASSEMLAFKPGTSERQLTFVDRSGEPQGTLKVPASMFNYRVSPDGRHLLAASSLTDSTGVWMLDLSRRSSTQVAADGIAAIWSPDGGRLAFTSRAGLDLHIRRSSGDGRPEPIVSDGSVKVLNDWSAAAQSIIYTRHDAPTLLDLWHVPVTGGEARPLINTPANEAQARLSPDGRWIAYASDSSGAQEIYVRHYPALDAPRRVSDGGGSQPQWRADQQELFFLSPDRSLMAVTVRPGASVSFDTPRRLFRAPIADSPSDARESYAAMPDGRSFLIDARRTSVPAPITVMRHWAVGLTPLPAALEARHAPAVTSGAYPRSR